MAVRGVYSDEEKKMLAKYEETTEAMSGWRQPLLMPVAVKEFINRFALAVDPWNPLWRDENYAKNTRWGGIIAPLGYLDAIAQITWGPEVPPSVGFGSGQWLGEDWDDVKPVHVNDSFRVWCRRPYMVDVTSEDGGPRAFRRVDHDVDVINQRDEIVVKFKLYHDMIILPEPPEKPEPEPGYKYTKEELAFIEGVFNNEEIRGATMRWWEDVSVGEELRPVAMGPTTLWDQIVYTAGRGEMGLVPMMEVRRKEPKMLLLDPVTGVTHHAIEFHHEDMAAQLMGLPRAIHYGIVQRQTMARCVTNWMGDDGFINRFHWRHLGHFYIGDSVVCRGRVTGKRVENGEHLVDISLWVENIRGYISAVAVATVSLLSSESLQSK